MQERGTSFLAFVSCLRFKPLCTMIELRSKGTIRTQDSDASDKIFSTKARNGPAVSFGILSHVNCQSKCVRLQALTRIAGFDKRGERSANMGTDS